MPTPAFSSLQVAIALTLKVVALSFLGSAIVKYVLPMAFFPHGLTLSPDRLDVVAGLLVTLPVMAYGLVLWVRASLAAGGDRSGGRS